MMTPTTELHLLQLNTDLERLRARGFSLAASFNEPEADRQTCVLLMAEAKAVQAEMNAICEFIDKHYYGQRRPGMNQPIAYTSSQGELVPGGVVLIDTEENAGSEEMP